MDYLELSERVREFAESHLSRKRYEHSMRVADMTKLLCGKFGVSQQKGYFSGIAHDICKEFSSERLLELASKDGGAIIELEREKPSLLHGRAAAVFLQEEFGLEDREILAAIAVHTSAAVGMDGLAKCLFVADKIEPGRPWSTPEYRGRLLAMELDRMLYTVLRESADYLEKKPGFKPFPQSNEILEYYRKLCEN